MQILKVLILFFVVISTTPLIAQQEKYDLNTDKNTYNYFTKKQFDSLKTAADEAFDKGIDFYYLRMRLGVMYYDSKNYMSAIPHFERAYEFYPKDSISAEYLYYSYLFSGRTAEANLLAEKQSALFKKKIKYSKPQVFSAAYTEAGYAFNSDYNNLKTDSLKIFNTTYSERAVINHQSYVNVSLLHNINNRLSIFHGFNNIGVSSLAQIEDYLDKKTFNIYSAQNEYYLTASYYIDKGFTVSAFNHFINIKSEYPSPNDSAIPQYSIKNYISFENAVGASVSKTLGHYSFSYGLSYANFSRSWQIQNNFGFVWYPLGNIDLYSVTGLIFHSHRSAGSSYITRGIFDQKAGIRIYKNLWTEGNVTIGNLINYIESNGFIVYNTNDKIKFKGGINLIYPLNKTIEVSLRYLYLQQEMQQVYYTNTTDFFTKNINTNIHKIIGGLKWTF